MTTITLPRAVVEQALEAMRCAVPTGKITLYAWDKAMSDLDAALAQEPHRDLRAALQAPGCERLREWVEIGPVQRAALETCVAALAQEQKQAEQTWVCPDSPEHRYKKPGHCEDCGNTLVLAQHPGCDHCNHPLYAATRCRVCGRVTEQAEPVEPVAWVRLEAWKSGKDWPDDCFTALPAEGLTPVYTAPPQRKPLTEEEISDLSREMVKGGKSVDWLCRAVERAHGISP